MQSIRLIAILAFLWLFSGWLMGIALRALFQVNWIFPCASLNLILGLVLLLLITRNERERRIFYEGTNSKMQSAALHLNYIRMM